MLGTGCGNNGVQQPTANPGALPNVLAQNQNSNVFTPDLIMAAVPSTSGVTTLVENLTNVNATSAGSFAIATANTVNSLPGGDEITFTDSVGTDLFAVEDGVIVPMVMDNLTGVLTAGTPGPGLYHTGDFAVFDGTSVVVDDSAGNLAGVPAAEQFNGTETPAVMDQNTADQYSLNFPGITWISTEPFSGFPTTVIVDNGAGSTPVIDGGTGTGFISGVGVNITGAVNGIGNALSGDLVTIQANVGGSSQGAIYSAAAGSGQLELGVAIPAQAAGPLPTFTVAQQLTVPLPVGNIAPTSMVVVNQSSGQNAQNQGGQQFLVIGTNVGLIVEIPILNGPTIATTGGNNPLQLFTFTTPDGAPVTGLGTDTLGVSNNNGTNQVGETVLFVVTPGVGLGQDLYGYEINQTGNAILVFNDEQGTGNSIPLGAPAASGNANPVVDTSQ
ncbi:MAG TPA: hypothetical protein VGO93_27500 [Candidatus Xenobia bacterium]|jgi:hypothetical protein